MQKKLPFEFLRFQNRITINSVHRNMHLHINLGPTQYLLVIV